MIIADFSTSFRFSLHLDGLVDIMKSILLRNPFPAPSIPALILGSKGHQLLYGPYSVSSSGEFFDWTSHKSRGADY
jgi:hypothetical protein